MNAVALLRYSENGTRIIRSLVKEKSNDHEHDMRLVSRAESAQGKNDETNQQNQTKPSSADCRATQVETAATEQKKKHKNKKYRTHGCRVAIWCNRLNGVFPYSVRVGWGIGSNCGNCDHRLPSQSESARPFPAAISFQTRGIWAQKHGTNCVACLLSKRHIAQS